jgi:hypothetical protein
VPYYVEKLYKKGYNFALDLTSIKGMHKKLWASKVVKVPILGISRLPTWANHKKYYKGEGGGFPSLGHDKSCEFVYVGGSSVHQKCSNYALTNLLFSLCKSIWIIDSLVFCPNPIPKLQHTPLPSKCYKWRNKSQLLLLFSLWDFHWVF